MQPRRAHCKSEVIGIFSNRDPQMKLIECIKAVRPFPPLEKRQTRTHASQAATARESGNRGQNVRLKIRSAQIKASETNTEESEASNVTFVIDLEWGVCCRSHSRGNPKGDSVCLLRFRTFEKWFHRRYVSSYLFTIQKK